MNIKLTKPKYDFLRKYLLAESRSDLIWRISEVSASQSVTIEVDAEAVDEIRDWASRKQQRIGFDENYKLTQEGKILEDLIDTFYLDR